LPRGKDGARFGGILYSPAEIPDGNGWEILEEIANLRPSYAIAISGYGTEADRQRSAQSGFRRHLVKPLFPESLDTLLKEATAELTEKE
jgi:CheY-like chemotaxis protein